MESKELKVHNELQLYIEQSELVKAAITEAVHRFYFDRVIPFKDRKLKGFTDMDMLEISNLHTNLWCLLPDWREVINNACIRYKDGIGSGRWYDVPLVNKPLNPLNIDWEIQFFSNNVRGAVTQRLPPVKYTTPKQPNQDDWVNTIDFHDYSD